MSASTTAASETPLKWWPFATICVPSSTARSVAANRSSAADGSRESASSRIELQLGQARRQFALEPLRAGPEPGELGRSTLGAELGCRLAVAAVMTAQIS